MITQDQQDVLNRLARLIERSPGARVGQLLAHLGFLAEDMFDRGLWDVDDEQLARVMERHESELAARQSNVA
jgi:hypothetical protein